MTRAEAYRAVERAAAHLSGAAADVRLARARWREANAAYWGARAALDLFDRDTPDRIACPTCRGAGTCMLCDDDGMVPIEREVTP